MKYSPYAAAAVVIFALAAAPPAAASDQLEPQIRRVQNRTRLAPGNAPAMGGFETLNFRAASACSPCHSANGSENSSGPNSQNPPVMNDQWSGSIMAYGAEDPFWQAKVQSEVLRAPQHRALIEKKCSPCHTPMAATEASYAGENVLLFEDGFLEEDHPLHAAAMEAISCTLCHRINQGEDFGTEDGFSGGYTIDEVDEPVDRPLYGPYDNTFNQPMQASVGMLNQFGDQINDPALCASCHNLKTPFLDADGVPAGDGFPEQMPYSEWQQSDFARADEIVGCQQCHMPIDDQGSIASRPGWLEERDRASHTFTSVNTETLSLLAAEAVASGDNPAALLESIEAGREMLQLAGALEATDPTIDSGGLQFTVHVANLTGHKLPTAFPSRRVYLHTVVSDDDDTIVFESGAMTPDGFIVGVDDDPGPFEYHHDTITAADEVQVYEAILGTTDDDPTCTLLRASQYLKDNRLLPTGFDLAAAPEDVLPVGDCLDDLNFGDDGDDVTYRIAGLTGGHYEVSIELRHQAISYPYVSDLVEFSDDPIVWRFLDLYERVQPGSELIAELSFEIGD